MPETPKSSAAVRESLIARGFIVLEGREQDFVNLESMLFSAHNPQGSLQLLIFKRILESTWNLQRCREAEIALWKSTNNPALDPLLDDANQRRYERIAKYARQNQINLRRATEDLRAIQRREQPGRSQQSHDRQGVSQTSPQPNAPRPAVIPIPKPAPPPPAPASTSARATSSTQPGPSAS